MSKLLLLLLLQVALFAQDLTQYTPEWIRDGFATAGSTHEPWMFIVRRGSSKFNNWQKEFWEYQQSEEYIKKLAESGVTVYHIFAYKGYGWEAEKEHMRLAAKAAKLAHKYGLKVDTYIQWNSMFYETFFKEVPQAKTDLWYQVNEVGKPSTLDYGHAPYRYRICFNSDDYMDYFKSKILKFAVDSIKTDFIHFDNFNFHHPKDVQYNPQTISAFRKYLDEKYIKAERMDRFGLDDFSFVMPPIWNYKLDPLAMKYIADPVMQEWCDFRCWTLTTRLKECINFVRNINPEIAIEINGISLQTAGIWKTGINHGDIMRYINAGWTEGSGVAEWKEDKISGKWRHFKGGHSTNTYCLSYKDSPQALAEALAINGTIGWSLPKGVETQVTGNKNAGIPDGENKKYVDFWNSNKELYSDVTGGGNIAVLRSYPSMAYSLVETHEAVNFVEQELYQQQFFYDVLFDEYLDKLEKYKVLILANQESLADSVVENIYSFVKSGGGLILTENTGKYNQWRRIRRHNAFQKMLRKDWDGKSTLSVTYGKGLVTYIPKFAQNNGSTVLKEEVLKVAKNNFQLSVDAPEWVGVSHTRKEGGEIVHLVNYRAEKSVKDAVITFKGKVDEAFSISPDRKEKLFLEIKYDGNKSILSVPHIDVYEIVVLRTNSKK